jgi:mono/diheme cytochrome c family protein
MRLCLALLAATLIVGDASGALADPAVEQGDPEKGKQVFMIYCVTCHGEHGDGKGPVGKTLQPPPRDFTVGKFLYGGTDQAIFEVITNGAASKGGSPLMAPWGAVITEQDRWNLVAFVRSLKK